MTSTAVIIKNGNVFAVKRAHEPEKGKWDFVGGFLNEGETPREALRREVKEELNVEVDEFVEVGSFPGTYQYKHEIIPITSMAYLVSISGEPKLSDENFDFSWLDPFEIDIAFDSNRLILHRVRQMIFPMMEVRQLIGQLDPTAQIDEFRLYAAQLNGFIATISEDSRLIGMGWIFPRTTALRKQAVIEDMIVDEAHRGKGYGRKILAQLIEWARDQGIDTIELTSNPKRIAANELYKKAGFQLHPTNHYLFKL